MRPFLLGRKGVIKAMVRIEGIEVGQGDGPKTLVRRFASGKAPKSHKGNKIVSLNLWVWNSNHKGSDSLKQKSSGQNRFRIPLNIRIKKKKQPNEVLRLFK